MAHDAFISYCTPEKEVADACVAFLEAQGRTCWISHRDIVPGQDYGEAIIEGLNAALCLVVVFSREANESPHVLREVERAVNRQIPVITFRVADLAPRQALEYFLSSPHWLDAWSGPLDGHLARLGRTLEALLGPVEPAELATADAPESAIAEEPETCAGCGKSAPPTAAFCPQCGHALEERCSKCGEASRTAQPFCTSCGVKKAEYADAQRRQEAREGAEAAPPVASPAPAPPAPPPPSRSAAPVARSRPAVQRSPRPRAGGTRRSGTRWVLGTAVSIVVTLGLAYVVLRPGAEGPADGEGRDAATAPPAVDRPAPPQEEPHAVPIKGIPEAPFGGAPVVGAFRERGRPNDPTALTRRGGSPETERAVDEALRWLAVHQSPSGGWEAAGFQTWCDGKPAPPNEQPTGIGKGLYDVGVTGLALSAFLGAGYTNRGPHPFASTISKGLRYLRNAQDEHGCFGARTDQRYVYNHATASLAMIEAYGMTESPIFKGAAQSALEFIALARNPYLAWRYGVKPGDNDTSITVWMTMALMSAQLINEDALARGKPAPFIIDEEALDGALTWIERMTDPDYGRTGYIQRGGGPARPEELLDRFPWERSESMTGAGMMVRLAAGEDPRRSRMLQTGAALCAKLPPAWTPEAGNVDLVFWYYATLALHQVGGDLWATWNTSLRTTAVASQRQDTTYCRYRGSWDPVGPWGPDGGRVYATAMMAMCLQVYYRYPRFFETR